jgi:hypothetical protein
MEKLWDTLVRWRTYVVNIVLALMVIAPEILNSPEVLAVIPAEYQRWFLAAAFVLNIWLRPRPASRADDPEVQIKKVVKEAEGPATVIVKAEGEVKAILDA